jgi:adenosine kinase
MPALISGSLAFDTIMNFEGKFSDQILADHIHKLNVSFFVPTLRRELGGCAGNIAYALKQLGGEALPLATLGPDGADYIAYFQKQGISTEFLRTVEGSYTALASIMTDRDNNQITAFHPGAMSLAHQTPVPADAQSTKGKIALGIVSPNGRDAMIEHAAQFKAAGIEFIFDPGQGLPMFGGDDLRAFIAQATWVTVNDYEGEMLCERTGLTFAQISEQVKGLVVTLGEHGCDVWQNGQATRVAPVKATAVVDPTGCGDAFRGALLFGLERGWDLAKCCALGNRLGALKIAQRGGQNYTLPAGYAQA